MKRFIHVLLIALLAMLGVGAGGCSSSRGYSASVDASYGYSDYDDEDYYYGSLDRYGTWVEVSTYGQVWCPLDVSAGWRPYTVGSWAYTDYGWMWIADDPWGNVPYHYGRWTFDSYYGWVWVPGDVWGPAWVSWRYGDGWAGWAPLPPDVDWRVGIGFSLNAYALDSRIDAYRWCFVPASQLTSRSIATRVVPPSRNVTYIPITQNVTNYTVINSQPAERGLRPEMIERDTGRRITPYRVVESRTPRGRRGAEIRGQNIEVYRPPAAVETRARDRARSQQRERVAPPRQLIQRQEVEQRRFEERMQSERIQLEREHQRELRQPPRGVSREELTRRQEAEMQAQKERETRERTAIDERTKRLKQRANDQDRENPNRGRGRGNQNNNQNRGRDRNEDRENTDE
ncbi:MAG TPA: DUF6600 domain-containing protein [Candidatus Eisenbacteria bacterium]|nr:DUF6600 domain-containing protein [Candidatus Eisenbacteria bacterium]